MASIFFLSALDSEILSCAYFSKLVKGDRVLIRLKTAIAKSMLQEDYKQGDTIFVDGSSEPLSSGSHCDRDFPLTFA
jgi:hypothetical protein